MIDFAWVGLDVAARDVQVCVLDNSGRVLGEGPTANCATEISAFISEAAAGKQCTIAMEACESSVWLSRQLAELGHKVSVLEAFRVSRFLKIRQNKTDVNDARGIADLIRFGGNTATEVFVKSIDCQKIRTQLVIRQSLIAQRVAVSNLIASVLRLNGGQVRRWVSATGLRTHVEGELAQLLERGVDLTLELEPLIKVFETLWDEVKELTAQLHRVTDSIEVCRRWLEIYGVGPMTALSFYSAIENPFRFKSSDDVGAYLGLAPRVKQSGTVTKRRGISRRGNNMTRSHLVSAALTHMKAESPESALKVWALTLKERAGGPRSRTALARKLAVTMIAMWKTGESFRPAPSI